jgi:N-acetylglucosaminyldiphosphoundecaprenol N-acetyl-beta-D-mannosaminyltransferase
VDAAAATGERSEVARGGEGGGDQVTDRVQLLGLAFDPVDLPGAVDRVGGLLDDGGFAQVVTPNVDFFAQIRRDRDLADAIGRADLVVADGVPLLWMARMQGTPLPGRVNGTDLMMALLERVGGTGHRVAFVGGQPGVAEAAAANAARRWGVTVAAAWGPSRAELDDGDAVATTVAATGADLVFLGVAAGYQEKWIDRHRGTLPGVSIGVGSAFDFLAERLPRAPVWMQRNGLEWAWRLSREPRRLWRRYLVDDPKVLAWFAAEQWRRRR